MLFLNIINHIIQQNGEVQAALSGYNGLVVGIRAGSLHIIGRINEHGLLDSTHRKADSTLLLHHDAVAEILQGKLPQLDDIAIEGDMPLGMAILWRCMALRYRPHADIRQLLGDDTSQKIAQTALQWGGILQTIGQILQRQATQLDTQQPARHTSKG